MNPEYGEFDGTPMDRKMPWGDTHGRFYSDGSVKGLPGMKRICLFSRFHMGAPGLPSSPLWMQAPRIFGEMRIRGGRHAGGQDGAASPGTAGHHGPGGSGCAQGGLGGGRERLECGTQMGGMALEPAAAAGRETVLGTMVSSPEISASANRTP